MDADRPDEEPARILIWGTGAIGGTVAACLRRAGHDVTAVDTNPHHIRAIRDRGLSIVGFVEQFTQPIRIATPDEVRGVWDTVFLCVKAPQTAAAARQLAPHVADDGVVVSLQNGFNELEIAAAVGRSRTMGAFINFGADVVDPGVVHYGGRGAVVVGELDGQLTPRLVRVHRILVDFAPDATVTHNIWGYLWGKMGYGAILFASALTEASIVDVLAARDVRPALVALARETMSVAVAEGVKPMGFNGYHPEAFGPAGTAEAVDASFDAMIGFNQRSAKTHTGVWRDIAVHHRKTEAEAQFAPILALARRHGIAVPHLKRLVSLIGEVETGARRQAWENLALLAAVEPSIDARTI